MALHGILSGLTFFKSHEDDDFSDRLHYFVTTNILLAFSFLISWKQFGGKPIECILPDGIPSSWEQYAEVYCWAKNTYFVPPSDPKIPWDIGDRTDTELVYYQWMPFLLIFQAMCFYLPSKFWQLTSGRSGIKIGHFVKTAADQQNMKPEVRKANLGSLSTHLENALKFHRRVDRRNITPHSLVRFLNLQYTAKYVTIMYVLFKIIQLGNCIGQWFLLNNFLKVREDEYYGLTIISNLLNGSSWEQTGAFPRVTLCDFRARTMGSRNNRHTVQCVLVINLFNEKIFLFLWFWFLAVAGVTVLSLIYWVCVMIFPCFLRNYVDLHMELSELPYNTDDPTTKLNLHKFVTTYLRRDGVFTIRMVEMHAGVIFATDLVCALWKRFYCICDNEQTSNGTQTQGKKKLEAKKKWKHLKLGFSALKNMTPPENDAAPKPGKRRGSYFEDTQRPKPPRWARDFWAHTQRSPDSAPVIGQLRQLDTIIEDNNSTAATEPATRRRM